MKAKITRTIVAFICIVLAVAFCGCNTREHQRAKAVEILKEYETRLKPIKDRTKTPKTS